MKFTIDIISDTVCPWCFVGLKRLNSGISAFTKSNPNQQHTFLIKWHPFYLNPNSPKQGVSKQAMYEQKFGQNRTRQMQQRLSAIGLEEGIQFKYGGKTGNTRDSHRLIHLASTKSVEMQTKVVEELFHAYFEDEQDITSHDVLREAAVKAGLQSSEVKGWLESDEGGDVVDKEVERAQGQHISGVPHFIINQSAELGGAQEPETFVEIFEELQARSESKGSGLLGGKSEGITC